MGVPALDILVATGGVLPAFGRTEYVKGVLFQPGGCALNAAVVLSRLGVRTVFAGLRGDDQAGRLLENLLSGEKLDLSRLGVREGRPTTVCIGFYGRGDDRGFLLSYGAGEELTLNDVGRLSGFSALHVGGAAGLGRLAVEELFSADKGAGALTTLDVENSPALENADRLWASLRWVDWFMPSEEEALRMTGTGNLQAAISKLRSFGARGIIVTRGARGALVSDSERSLEVPSPQVQAVDGTGAGDSFAAGFIAAMLWGFDPVEAARFGCACGAKATTCPGATGAVRSLGSVLELLDPDLRVEAERRASESNAG